MRLNQSCIYLSTRVWIILRTRSLTSGSGDRNKFTRWPERRCLLFTHICTHIFSKHLYGRTLLWVGSLPNVLGIRICGSFWHWYFIRTNMRNKYLGLILLWRKKLGYISQIDIWDKKRLINGRKRWFMLSLVPRNCGGKVVVNWIGQYFSPTVSRAWIKNKKIFSVRQCQVAKSNTFFNLCSLSFWSFYFNSFI